MFIKKIIKKIIGQKNIDNYKKQKRIREYVKCELKFMEKTETEKVWLRTIIMAHSIEKSMAIMDVKSLSNLNRYMKGIEDCVFLLNHGYSENSYVIREIVSVIEAACDFVINENIVQEDAMINIINSINLIKEKYHVESNGKAGINEYSKGELSKGEKFEWVDFSESRKSIRIFSEKIIDKETIKHIIEDARFYPSACNRQPCNIYYATSLEKNNTIKKYINDQRTVHSNIHNFFVVTSDNNKFAEGELYQNYINGGIFLAYLVLSIHSHGLGSCIFQHVQHNKREKDLYSELRIPPNESIIAFVGYGEIIENNKILCAARNDFSDMAKEII